MRGGLRIGTWNVEWFDKLFGRDGALQTGGWSGRRDVTRAAQAAAIREVLRAIDADLWLIVEAPDVSRRRDGGAALERFAREAGLRAAEVLIGFSNDTRQELALLHDPAKLAPRHDPRSDPSAPRFDMAFEIDLDIDGRRDVVRFSKPPLEAEIPGLGRLIGVHLKSKAPHGARDAAHARALQIANRRKQLAQAVWLRRRIDGHLAAGDPLIVLGDFNDGPGLDAFEALFGRSSADIVGEGLATGPPGHTTHFETPQGPLDVALDFAMLSPGLARGARWRIWHPALEPRLRRALETASDHFPVTVDLEVP
ncbi:MAG: endonuclease/exonuclease/phosphatase family protein [Hasllibacter sp.]